MHVCGVVRQFAYHADMQDWFDGHLDLAYLAELGRDMHAPLSDCRGQLQPAAVTLPSLRDGGVRACLGTIFTEAIETSPGSAGGPLTLAKSSGDAGAYMYPAHDVLAAWKAGMRQLKLYQAWQGAGVIRLMPRRGQVAATGGDALVLGILMEGADPIENPDDAEVWADAGVIAVGLSWWRGSRYAGGNGTPGRGLTDIGRELVGRLDRLGVVHDLSHLSQQATDELLELTPATPIASHSNCRALLEPDNERHVSDETIREIGRRGGMIGLNLVRNFIRTGIRREDPKDRPTVAEAVRHVEHVCAIVGNRRCVGLGSDMDGGITANDLPEGINQPSDLRLIAEELQRLGWSDAEIRGFAYENWARFWRGGA